MCEQLDLHLHTTVKCRVVHQSTRAIAPIQAPAATRCRHKGKARKRRNQTLCSFSQIFSAPQHPAAQQLSLSKDIGARAGDVNNQNRNEDWCLMTVHTAFEFGVHRCYLP